MLTYREYEQLVIAIEAMEGINLAGRCPGFYVQKRNVMALLQRWTDCEFEEPQKQVEKTE